jgi:hypothetical protein
MKKVLKNLQEHPDIQLVRVKNRLETANRDFLINFAFKDCRLLCELQVGLKETEDTKE